MVLNGIKIALLNTISMMLSRCFTSILVILLFGAYLLIFRLRLRECDQHMLAFNYYDFKKLVMNRKDNICNFVNWAESKYQRIRFIFIMLKCDRIVFFYKRQRFKEQVIQYFRCYKGRVIHLKCSLGNSCCRICRTYVFM